MTDKNIVKGNKGVVFIAVTVVLCCVAILGVFGILAYGELRGDRFRYLSTDTYRFMNLLSWIILGINLTLCGAGWLFKFEVNDIIKSRIHWEGDFQQQLKKELDIGIFIFDIFMMLTFLFIGIRFFTANDKGVILPLWMAVLLGAVLIVLSFFRLQLKNLCRNMENHPREQRTRERTDRDRAILYRSGYRTFMITGRILLAGMVLVMVFTRFSSSLSIAMFIGMGMVRMFMEAIFLYEKKILHKKMRKS